MIPLPTPIKISLLDATKLVLQNCPEHLKFIIVKDGVANVTNGRFYLRVDVSAVGYKDGYYHMYKAPDGSGWYLHSVTPERTYNGVINTGIDPEILRPNFETLAPLCVIENPFQMFTHILTDIIDYARQNDDKVVIEPKGIGLKRDGARYMEFNFGVKDIMYFDATQAYVCFTDVLRHERIYIYQEPGPRYEEGILTPLIVGSGWRNCSIMFPIPDRYRGSYTR